MIVVLVTAGASKHRPHPRSSSADPATLTAAGASGAPPLTHPPPAPSSSAADRTIDRVLASTSYISLGAGHRREVALTFDDGPGVSTPALLGVLRRRHVPATFFEVGTAIKARPDLVRREVRAGYPIGDHTVNHAFLGRLPSAGQQAEIVGQANALKAAGAPYPRLFRPPYGSFDPVTLEILKAQRMLMVLWSVDTRDFSRPGTPRIVYTALSGARPGAIILMHDGGGDRSQTVAAVPRIVKGLRRRGFTLVTVPELLRGDPPPPHQPAPHSLAG